MMASKEYDKMWRKNNPERVKASQRKYYQKNKHKVWNRSKQWIKDNPEKYKEACLRYALKHSIKYLPRLPTEKQFGVIRSNCNRCVGSVWCDKCTTLKKTIDNHRVNRGLLGI